MLCQGQGLFSVFPDQQSCVSWSVTWSGTLPCFEEPFNDSSSNSSTPRQVKTMSGSAMKSIRRVRLFYLLPSVHIGDFLRLFGGCN